MTTRVIKVDFLNEKGDRNFILGKISGIIEALNGGDKNFSMHGNLRYPNTYIILFRAGNEDFEKIRNTFLEAFGRMNCVTITVYEKKES